MLLRELYLSGNIQRPAEIIRAMREAHHAGLVSGRRKEDALGAHLAVELFENGVLDALPAGKFSTLQAIHKYLFEDIYDFAGKLRT